MAEFKYSDDQIKKYIDGIYAGTITEHKLPEDLYFAIADYLKSGLYSGFGGTLSDFSGKDFELLSELRENTYMFSAAKTYQQTFDQKKLLFDEEGNLRSSKEFTQLAEKNFDTWNDAWGRSEYSTAVGQGAMASQWQRIEENKDILPILTFDATGEECPICQPFEGLSAPVDDPVWDWATPLLHFNCECVIIQGDEDTELSSKEDYDKVASLKDTVPEPFRMNPGKDKYIFSPDHPYFDVAKKDIPFAKENFGLPIPPVTEEVKTPITGLTLESAKQIMPDFKISAEEGDALKKYTGGKYNLINEYFRGIRKSISDENNEISKTLDSFLDRAPKVTTESYRSITLDEYKFESFKKFKKGNSFTDKAFMSTSYDKITAEDFGNNAQYQVEMIIKGKSGVLIEDFSDAKKEKEILFGRDSNFKIESIKTTEKKGITGKIKMTLIEL
jgi:hypothetical protein